MKLVIPIAVAIILGFLSPIDVGAQKGWKTYTVDDEYSFQYPSNWKLQERENRFTSIDAKLKYGNNDVQMIFEGYPIEVEKSDEEKLQALESVIESKESGNIFESGIDKQMINNRSAPYVIGTYTIRSLFGISFDMVELITAVHLPNNQLVIVQYIAEDNNFDKYLPKVKQVVKSISSINSTQAGNNDLDNLPKAEEVIKSVSPINSTETHKTEELPKCGAKIQVNVVDLYDGTEFTTVVTLNGVTKTKTQIADLKISENTTKVPFTFEKLNPCPEIGDQFVGTAHYYPFSGKIQSLEEPNIVTVIDKYAK